MQRGFTLIELLVAIALMMALAFAGFFNLLKFKKAQDLDLDAKIIVSFLRDAQQRSILQENDDQWGVYFNNQASNDYYELFKGASYAAGTVYSRRSLKPSIEFTQPVQGTPLEIVFAKLSGTVAGQASTIINIIGDLSSIKTVIVNPNGSIVYQ